MMQRFKINQIVFLAIFLFIVMVVLFFFFVFNDI